MEFLDLSMDLTVENVKLIAFVAFRNANLPSSCVKSNISARIIERPFDRVLRSLERMIY